MNIVYTSKACDEKYYRAKCNICGNENAGWNSKAESEKYSFSRGWSVEHFWDRDVTLCPKCDREGRNLRTYEEYVDWVRENSRFDSREEPWFVLVEGIRDQLAGSNIYGQPLDMSNTDQVIAAAYYLGGLNLDISDKLENSRASFLRKEMNKVLDMLDEVKARLSEFVE